MTIEELLQSIKSSIDRCKASPIEIYEALLDQADSWKIVLEVLRNREFREPNEI